MKRSNLYLLLALACFTFGYTSDKQDNGVSKIHLVGTTLIRTTPGEAIRFYDLSNPAAPREVASTVLQGNHDVATKGNYLYADSDYDMVVYDISDRAHPRSVDTIKKVFNNPYYYRETVPEEISVGGASGCGCATDDIMASPETAGSSSGNGKSGSLARFAVVGNYLYCVDASALRIFDISDPARPRYKNAIDIGWGIETLFPHNEYLFIGSQDGMYVYRHQGDNANYVSKFTHRRNCDPVVVEGDRAYVTLRGGSACGGFDNQMDIIDISAIASPQLITSVPLTGPYGLTVRDGLAVVCDGTAGLKTIDVRNESDVQIVGSVTDIVPHDVILGDSLLIVTAESGYFLYDATDLRSLKRIGQLQF